MTAQYRIHSTFIPGSPGFSALAVEITSPGKPGWQILDLYCLKTWLTRPDARQEMRALLQELELAGYQPQGEPCREAA